MPESYEDLARSALLEITPVATIGSFVSQTPEDDGSVTVRFASAQPGYPDWLWTVSVADVEGGEPTVLEAELLPGEDVELAKVLAFEQHLALGLRVDPGDDVDQGRLARAVAAEQRMDLTGCDLQVGPGQGAGRAEDLGNVGDKEEWLAHVDGP